MTRLFIDMDGVLADFDRHYEDSFGENPWHPREHSHDEVWKNIAGHEGEFFAELPKMPGFSSLVRVARFLENDSKVSGVFILTAAGNSQFDTVGKQKRKWLKEHLPYDWMVLTTRKGVDKAAFVQSPGDILIDDMDKNCDAWEAAGGKAVRYTSVLNGLAQLDEVFYGENFS